MRDDKFDNMFENDFETSDAFDIFGKNAGTQNDEVLDEAQELYATMGYQMEYTDSLRDKKDNRRLETVQFVEIDKEKSSEITRKLISTYGNESMQVKKWIAQLQKIERYRELQQRAIRKRKRQTVLMGIIAAASVLIVVGILYFALNSTTYYINQGDYDHIYEKNMLGVPQVFYDKASYALQKYGSDLYFVSKSDMELNRMSVKTRDIQKISESKVAEFRIIGKYIYYTNSSDYDKLYRMRLDGSGNEMLVDKACVRLSNDGKKLMFDDKESGNTVIIDTSNLSVTGVSPNGR